MRVCKSVFVCAVIGFMASLITGCDSSDSGGDGPSGSSTISGTVTDVEGASAAGGFVAVRAGVVTEGVRVRVVGTDLSTTTVAGGFFIISGVPAGSVTLRFEFGGVVGDKQVDVPENATIEIPDIRVRSGSVSSGRVDIRVRADRSDGDRVDNSGPGSANSGRDDDDDDDDDSDDDDDDSDDDEVEVRGLIQSISAESITVNGTTFRINSSTRLMDDRKRPVGLDAFPTGQLVEVEGELVNGVLIAREIEIEDD